MRPEAMCATGHGDPSKPRKSAWVTRIARLTGGVAARAFIDDSDGDSTSGPVPTRRGRSRDLGIRPKRLGLSRPYVRRQ